MNWLLDGLTVAVIVLFTVSAYKKGFLNAVVRFLGTLIAFIFSMVASAPAAEFIFDNYLAESIASVVKTHMGSIKEVDVAAFADGMSELISDLPELFAKIMENGFGVHAEEWYALVSAETVSNMTDAVIENIIAPLATGLIRVLVFCVVFALLKFLVNALAALLIGVNKLPLIGSLNEVLGGVVGAAQGMLYMFIIASIVWLALFAAGGTLGPVSAETVSQTLLFKEFYNIGPWVQTTAGLL